MDILCELEMSALTVGFFFHLLFEHKNKKAIIYNKYYIPKGEIIFWINRILKV